MMTMVSVGCFTNTAFLSDLVGEVVMNLITLSLHYLSHSNCYGLFNYFIGCLTSDVALVKDLSTVALPFLILSFLALIASLIIFIDDGTGTASLDFSLYYDDDRYTGTAGLRHAEQALWLFSYSEMTVVEGDIARLEMGGLALLGEYKIFLLYIFSFLIWLALSCCFFSILTWPALSCC